MTEIKISDLSALAARPADGDLFVIVDVSEVLDSDKTKRILLSTIGVIGGWVEVSGWLYASATTITVPAGAALIYAVGDQVRLKQGGAYKYFSIIAVADTLLTVTGGSDFSVANAAITDAAFSKGGGVGHPVYFNYSPTVTYSGGTTNPTSFSFTLRFCVNRRTVFVQGLATLIRGSGDRTRTTITLPIDWKNSSYFAGAVSWSMNHPNAVAGEAGTNVFDIRHSTMTGETSYFRISFAYEI